MIKRKWETLYHFFIMIMIERLDEVRIMISFVWKACLFSSCVYSFFLKICKWLLICCYLVVFVFAFWFYPMHFKEIFFVFKWLACMAMIYLKNQKHICFSFVWLRETLHHLCMAMVAKGLRWIKDDNNSFMKINLICFLCTFLFLKNL